MKKKSSKAVRYNKWGYIFLIPFILVYVVFQLIPLFNTIYNSFFENYLSEVVVMMLMMDDAVVGEKAESVEKEYSALAREIEFRLTPYLYQLGIPPHVTGYSYLRSAVVEFLLNPSEMREITKTIYPRIALDHGTTVSAVERAIRHAIAAAWNNGGLRGIKGDPCTALLTFRRKPTNKGCITAFADMIRLVYGTAIGL